MSTIYKGSLSSKTKGDLADMASALGLSAAGDKSIRRDKLEALVKQHLLEHRGSLESSKSWAGVYNSFGRGEARKSALARNSSAALSP
jgi:hypothetical protein